MLIFFQRPFPNLLSPYRNSIFSSGVHRPVRWMGPPADDCVRDFVETEALPSSSGGAKGGDIISWGITSFLICSSLSSIGVSRWGMCMIRWFGIGILGLAFVALSWNHGKRSGIFSHPNLLVRYLPLTHEVRKHRMLWKLEMVLRSLRYVRHEAKI